jgi:hypothetical protein
MCKKVLCYKDHIWSPTSHLAKMREWAVLLGEHLTIDGALKLEMIGSENAAHLEI